MYLPVFLGTLLPYKNKQASTNALLLAFGRQYMTRKSDREKIKMRIDQGVFKAVLGENGDLGTVLQSGLDDDEPSEKVHAPATLWITTKVKVRDKALHMHLTLSSLLSRR